MITSRRARLYLMGSPKLETAGGHAIPLTSKKAVALLAALATSDRLDRSRVWLQQILWGSRGQKQAQSSLRRELSNLRAMLAAHDIDIIETGHRAVLLKRDEIEIDIWDAEADHANKEFCEGIDLAGEDGFEDWLRDMRSNYAAHNDAKAAPKTAIAPIVSRPKLTAKLAITPTTICDGLDQAAGLKDHINDRLYRGLVLMKWLPVVDATGYKPIDASQLQSEEISQVFGLRYIVRSRITGMGRDATVSFTLIEMPSNVVRWTDTRKIPVDPNDDKFDAEIARAINCLACSFEICEQQNGSWNNNAVPPSLIDKIVRIRYYIAQFTEASFENADELLRVAMANHADNNELLLAQIEFLHRRHWGQRLDDSKLNELIPLVRAAIRADPSDARGFMFAGVLDIWQKRNASALGNLERACELNPSLAEAFAHVGAAHFLSGSPEKAIAPLKHALFIAPQYAKKLVIHGNLCIAYWMNGEFEKSLETAHEIQLTDWGFVLAKVMEVANYVELNLPSEAEAVRSEILSDNPERYWKLINWIPFEDEKWSRKLRAAIDPEEFGEERYLAASNVAGW